MYRRWVSWLLCALVLCLATTAHAGDFVEIRVCVRPPNVPPGVEAWVYTPGSATVVVKVKREDFKKQAGGLTTYVFDPGAPPDNTKLLPIPFNKLPCAARVLPIKPIEPPTPDAKKDDPTKTAGTKAATGTDKKKEKDKAEEEPPGLPKPIAYAQGERPPPPEPHLTSIGVTKEWPATVLPVVKRGDSGTVLPSASAGGSVLPNAAMNGGVLPTANKAPAAEAKSEAKDATGDGVKKGGGVEKTPYEKGCEQLGLLGGLVNLQLSEDIHRADGSKYGVPGGKNPNGIKSPTAQAVAGSLLVAAAVITAGGFDKKLYDALKKGAPIFIRGGGKAAEQAAEKLVQDAVAAYGKHGAEDLAAALANNGAIGEYSVMAKFTQGLGGKWQAHHLLEKSLAKDFELGAADRIPSVILSDVEHKAITKRLATTTRDVQTVEELWAAYQKAYKDHPAWLAAIKRYFVK